MKKPIIVCYCGSMSRALEQFKKAQYESLESGIVALLPSLYIDIQKEFGADSDYKKKADENHKLKIDISDLVVILNVDGYIGESTMSELKYAISKGKTVKFLEPIKAEYIDIINSK